MCQQNWTANGESLRYYRCSIFAVQKRVLILLSLPLTCSGRRKALRSTAVFVKHVFHKSAARRVTETECSYTTFKDTSSVSTKGWTAVHSTRARKTRTTCGHGLKNASIFWLPRSVRRFFIALIGMKPDDLAREISELNLAKMRKTSMNVKSTNVIIKPKIVHVETEFRWTTSSVHYCTSWQTGSTTVHRRA